MKYKVFPVDFGVYPDGKFIELENLLNDGWTIFRTDGNHPGGETSHRGFLIYILQKED